MKRTEKYMNVLERLEDIIPLAGTTYNSLMFRTIL